MSRQRRYLAAALLCAAAWPASMGCASEPEPLDDAATLEGPGVDRSAAEGRCEGGGTSDSESDPFADCVDAFSPQAEASFGHQNMPDVVLGPPVGGTPGGSTDVVSLGCGGQVTLFFDPPGIQDGPGPDLAVFENPFWVGEETFAEPARVLVSEDGEDWRAFACELTEDASWPPDGCAGVTPVAANAENGLSLDPEQAGGDWFDLEEVGLDHARYVRLVDVSEAYFGTQTWCSGAPAGFDLDAVVAVPR